MNLKTLLNKYYVELDKYRIKNAILDLFKAELKELDYYWRDNINCFGSNNDFKLLQFDTNPLKWKDFIDLIDSLIITDNCREVDDFDLRLVDSISNSKSNNTLNYFANINLRKTNIKPKDILYLFGHSIFEREKWKLESCINHFHNNKTLEIFHYEWSNLYEWYNGDGSHHFAVAMYHLRNENQAYKAKVKITTKRINQKNLKELLEKYDFFMTHKNNAYKVCSLFEQTSISQYYNVFSLHNKDFCLLVFKKQQAADFIIKIFSKLDSKYFFHWNEELKRYMKEDT
ncbi:hypothetical protein HXR77_000242 [Campylobacter upsaliensis]|nr:hypothetical protein [Campylobacter upsaliensis]